MCVTLAAVTLQAQNITKLVILPLYPQFSICTSGSALRVLERMLYTDPGEPETVKVREAVQVSGNRWSFERMPYTSGPNGFMGVLVYACTCTSLRQL